MSFSWIRFRDIFHSYIPALFLDTSIFRAAVNPHGTNLSGDMPNRIDSPRGCLFYGRTDPLRVILRQWFTNMGVRLRVIESSPMPSAEVK